MKSFLIAMSIFVFLIVSGTAFDSCLNKTSKELLASCEQISSDIQEDEMQDANAKSKELSKYIDEKKPLLSSILDHSSIDEIEKEVSELLGYTEEDDRTNAVVSIKELKHMFNHLPENYSLRLQNIL